MEMTKLTIRIPATVLERAKSYAEINHTSISRLVAQYLDQLPLQESDLDNAPIVRSLIGILSPQTSVEDYWQHIDEKYGHVHSNPD